MEEQLELRRLKETLMDVLNDLDREARVPRTMADCDSAALDALHVARAKLRDALATPATPITTHRRAV